MADAFDVIVIGAGPAGLSAARAAASAGKRVALVDNQARPGGQVWRHDLRHGQPADARRVIDALPAGVHRLADTQVVAATTDELLLQNDAGGFTLAWTSLVIATGGRELLMPFPGWTLPGVTGAGGLQALAKQGWPLAGRRVVIAGSGPLLLAAAATARRHGAQVLAIAEQASPTDVNRFAASLWRWPGKLAQAVALRTRLAGVPYRTDTLAVAAHGGDRVDAVELRGPGGVDRIDCDLLAVGYGLVPQMELADALGCTSASEGAHRHVAVDARQATSVVGVYAAGEACGIGGRDCALVEGEIAGLAAAGVTPSPTLLRRRDHARAFAARLNTHFALRDAVRALPDPQTIVCRCEDVTWEQLQAHAGSRAAKLGTRCGMGACQGRVCGGALAELRHFHRGAPRPPVFPARLATLGEPQPFDSSVYPGVHP
ncbi:FAD-dependent oxidoreductase [Luteibacter sahnii]|uniref:FAD-dependent oxidoreductase n=1 Tax=Luteibacter sahnii TaxID=3021977 RepID=UPI002A6A53C3|nr:FAD-dependent oxidoreductase [Luteibacter sp. PPL193]MDY1547642.1 FAD-dependent oxidoreductase [Luteibacter sp. PPL193]